MDDRWFAGTPFQLMYVPKNSFPPDLCTHLSVTDSIHYPVRPKIVITELRIMNFCSIYWSLIHTSKFWISILILKVQRITMSFKSWFGALEEARGSWLGFAIFILIWIWSLVFDTPLIQILEIYVDLKGAKNTHILKVLIWRFWGHWGFLTGFWHHDIDLDRVTGLW